MRRCAAAVIGLLLVTAGLAGDGAIDGGAILEHVKFLASDELRGRGNGTDGLERAGDYVGARFKDAGLEPGWRGGWYQSFELVAGLTIGQGNSLVIEDGSRRVQLTLGTSYYPLAAPANDDAQSASARLRDVPLVFAGYGISAPAADYDDYARVDVSGKAVVIFSHEPQERESSSRLNGARPLPQTTLQAKAAAARGRGAVALLVIGDPAHRTDEADYALFAADPDAVDEGIPVLRVRRTEMQPLVEAWQLDAAARLIDKDLVPRSQPLRTARVSYEEHLARNRRTVRNVVGILRGSDPARAGEALVIGAHYDHVGIGGRLSVTPARTGEIHNGADDNASGTASIIEMARAAAASRSRFPRTLVFVAFAGEERGLLGSAQYAAEPALPLDRTVAMLNLDMVGRANGGVDVSGLESAPSIERDLKAATEAAPALNIRRQGPGAGRSDDWSFLSRRIPAINFFTGFHNDYHRPGDDWDKIDADGTRRVATLALELAARLAERSDRPEFRAATER